jgi:hypothetical protein
VIKCVAIPQYVGPAALHRPSDGICDIDPSFDGDQMRLNMVDSQTSLNTVDSQTSVRLASTMETSRWAMRNPTLMQLAKAVGNLNLEIRLSFRPRPA